MFYAHRYNRRVAFEHNVVFVLLLRFCGQEAEFAFLGRKYVKIDEIALLE